MKVRKLVAFSAGTLMLVTNITPILADEAYSMDTNIVVRICEDSINGSSKLINDIIDGIEIEKEEPKVVNNEISSVQQPVVYSYVEQEIPTEQTMSVDEFMALYGSMVEEESQEVPVPVDTSAQQAAYDEALVNYNTALAAYEAANQMVETTKEVEVEIIEEVTDEEGNVTQVPHTEIQTITEMVPAGDVVSSQANLDTSKAAFDNASIQLEAMQSQTTIVEQSKVEDTSTIPTIVIEPEQEQKTVIEEDVEVTEEVTQATSGTCGDDLTWELDNAGKLVISGTGKMTDWYGNAYSKAPWGTSITSVEFNNGVTYIGRNAFADCTSLTSIIIPNSVTSIGPLAFAYCHNLTKITIPSSVNDFWLGVFSGCGFKTAGPIGTGCDYEFGWTTSIPAGAFDGCSSLISIIIPDSVTRIDSYTFRECESLKSVTIPNGVSSLGNNAFEKCSSLTNIIIPNSVTRIQGSTFFGCSSLTSITIPNSVTYIGRAAFADCTGLKNVTIPNGITTVEEDSFNGCTSLSKVTIPNSVTKIGYNSFNHCTSLTNINIPDSVTTILGNAFYGCKNLTKITISDNITSIGNNAFANCEKLTDVYFWGTKDEWSEKNLYTFDDGVIIHFLGHFPFSDVPQDAWYYSTAKECYETGLINGTSATTFSPMQTMTRAMVVTILWRMDGQPKTDFNNKFKDVSSSQWYASSISWAVNNGVVNGYGDGTFKPDGAVTREQVAVMLANYAGYKKVYKPGTKKLNTYPDGSQVSTWAQQGMKWALTNGIVSGDGAGYLRPKKSATRAEGAAMLLRMNNWL